MYGQLMLHLVHKRKRHTVHLLVDKHVNPLAAYDLCLADSSIRLGTGDGRSLLLSILVYRRHMLVKAVGLNRPWSFWEPVGVDAVFS
jgi:hypothetical protein